MGRVGNEFLLIFKGFFDGLKGFTRKNITDGYEKQNPAGTDEKQKEHEILNDILFCVYFLKNLDDFLLIVIVIGRGIDTVGSISCFKCFKTIIKRCVEGKLIAFHDQIVVDNMHAIGVAV